MFTESMLKKWAESAVSGFAQQQALEGWLPAIAKLLNAYGGELDPGDHELDVQLMLQQVAYLLGKSEDAKPEQVKNWVINSLKDGAFVQPPTSVNSFLMPSPTGGGGTSTASLKESKTLHLILKPTESSKLSRLRSETTKKNGRKLVEAAISLKGKLRWLPRGEEGFLPLSPSLHPAHGKGINLFIQWVSGSFEMPTSPVPRMNCWESVLYTAYCAGLVSKGVLRGIYEEAVLAAQQRFGSKGMMGLLRNQPTSTASEDAEAALYVYMDILFKKLGGLSAVHAKPFKDNATPPKKGDLVFIDHLGHVCISVGVQDHPIEGKTHCVMSLWTHDDEQYTLLPYKTIVEECRYRTMKFLPCPF